MHLKSKKKTITINTGRLVYTFTKLGDNLTNNGGDIVIAAQTRREIQSPFSKHAERAKLSAVT